MSGRQRSALAPWALAAVVSLGVACSGDVSAPPPGCGDRCEVNLVVASSRLVAAEAGHSLAFSVVTDREGKDYFLYGECGIANLEGTAVVVEIVREVPDHVLKVARAYGVTSAHFPKRVMERRVFSPMTPAVGAVFGGEENCF